MHAAAATVSAIANPFKHRLIHNNPAAKHSIAILVDIDHHRYQVTAVGGNKRLKLANLRKVPIKSSSHPLRLIPLILPLPAALNHLHRF